MRIAQINNNSQNFYGYLDKSVYRYVNMAALNTKADIYRISAKMPKNQVNAALAQFDRLKQSTIENLEQFILKCHADTFLKIEKKSGDFPKLVLNNKKLKLERSILGEDIINTENEADKILPIRNNLPEAYKGEYIHSLTITDLTQIKNYSEQLSKMSPIDADLKILNKYKQQCQNNPDKKQINLIQKFLKEIGLE